MLSKMFSAMLVIAVAFAFSSVSNAQESAKMEVKKDEKRALKSVTCDPACGFMVRSHDEKELVSVVKEHAKHIHNKEMSDKEVLAMVKPAEMKSREKMKIKKDENK